MRRVIRVERHPAGPRLWVAGRRIHHGAVGITLGLVLAFHDRADWRDWFRHGR